MALFCTDISPIYTIQKLGSITLTSQIVLNYTETESESATHRYVLKGSIAGGAGVLILIVGFVLVAFLMCIKLFKSSVLILLIWKCLCFVCMFPFSSTNYG